MLQGVGQTKRALLDGPVTAAIAVTPDMVFYAGGVFDDPQCVGVRFEDLNH